MANPQPDEFTRISNELFEAIILSNFKKRQLNIILLVIRLSYGCGHKYAILRQADFQLIGIDKSDIKKELNLLVESGVLSISLTGERITLNKDYERWSIPRAQPGGQDKFKQLLARNLMVKTTTETVGETPANANPEVGKIPTPTGIPVGKIPTNQLVKHQPDGWQNTNSVVGKTPTPKTLQANGDNCSDYTERNIKETLKKSKEKQTCMYDTYFEKFWTVYPRKVEKQRAYRCWKIRIREGLAEGLTMEGLVRDLVDAAKHYAYECQKNGTQQRYIKLAATFLGPDKPYMDWINAPAANAASNNQSNTQLNKKKELIRSLYKS
ncbi:replication protein [Desulfotruncus alcoholivorax]|uniref:replication protein n=1 Tax=Desulfotruncus alcoholivorax TaxID=265477 RepID=UPI00042688D2|nr:replication protein [Desulfotruncus alcoholivorax]